MFSKKLFIAFICFSLVGCGMFNSKEQNNESAGEMVQEISQPNIVISSFGDSITAGFGINKDDAYPAQLQEKIVEEGYHNYTVVNNGVSGETTKGGRARIEWVLKQNPEILILVLGGNDMLRGLDPKETYKNLSEIIEIAQENNTKILLGGMQALDNLGVNYVEEFNAVYPKLVEEYNLSYMPFFLEGVALDPKYNIADGIHPNKEGYNIIVENMWQYLEPLLEQNK